MKRVLIISPYFAPINAADTHRVRTSLSYYAAQGWTAEVVTVHPRHCDMVEDELLLQSVPEGIQVHYIQALDKRWTSKIGLGSIALRSLWFYYSAVHRLFKSSHFDLIFFSTTQFPVLALAAIWKKQFKLKIVFDIQDPWYTTYYKLRPRHERPKKFWFSYYLNKMLEPLAMRAADGLISVSAGYVEVLQQRYPHLKKKPCATIPFGMHLPDLAIANTHQLTGSPIRLQYRVYGQAAVHTKMSFFNLVYIGRGGYDLLPAFRQLVQAVQLGLKKYPQTFQKLKVQLIGTSYAPKGSGTPSFDSELRAPGLKEIFQESTDRLPYFQCLNTLQAADMLFMPGPDQKDYVASKLFPYLMVQRPILAIVHSGSTASSILSTVPQARVFHIGEDDMLMHTKVAEHLRNAIEGFEDPPVPEPNELGSYSSKHFTRLQTNLFNQVCESPD